MSKFNAAFWKWFGDSKVVDPKGQPLVVYHGTNHAFSAFNDEERYGINWFTSSTEIAKRYGDKIVSAYLYAENPLVLDAKGARWEEIEYTAKMRRAAKQAGMDFDGYDDGTIDSDLLAKIAKRGGWDGLVIKNVMDGPDFNSDAPPSTTYAVFRPTQIKSIDNDGTWDADDPNIRSNPMHFDPFVVAEKVRKLEYKSADWLARGNECAEKGQNEKAEKYYDKSTLALMQANELVESTFGSRADMTAKLSELRGQNPITREDLQRGLKRAMAAGDKEAVAALSAEIERLGASVNPPRSPQNTRFWAFIKYDDGGHNDGYYKSYDEALKKVLSQIKYDPVSKVYILPGDESGPFEKSEPVWSWHSDSQTWTNRSADVFVSSIATELHAVGLKLTIVGDVAELGFSGDGGLDISVDPMSSISISDAIEGIKSALGSALHKSYSRGVREGWVFKAELSDGRPVKFVFSGSPHLSLKSTSKNLGDSSRPYYIWGEK